MQMAKVKVKNVASAAKKEGGVRKVNVQEKADAAPNQEEKAITKEKMEAKEAQAKSNLQANITNHAGEKPSNEPAVADRYQPVGITITIQVLSTGDVAEELMTTPPGRDTEFIKREAQRSETKSGGVDGDRITPGSQWVQ